MRSSTVVVIVICFDPRGEGVSLLSAWLRRFLVDRGLSPGRARSPLWILQPRKARWGFAECYSHRGFKFPIGGFKFPIARSASAPPLPSTSYSWPSPNPAASSHRPLSRRPGTRRPPCGRPQTVPHRGPRARAPCGGVAGACGGSRGRRPRRSRRCRGPWWGGLGVGALVVGEGSLALFGEALDEGSGRRSLTGVPLSTPERTPGRPGRSLLQWGARCAEPGATRYRAAGGGTSCIGRNAAAPSAPARDCAPCGRPATCCASLTRRVRHWRQPRSTTWRRPSIRGAVTAPFPSLASEDGIDGPDSIRSGDRLSGRPRPRMDVALHLRAESTLRHPEVVLSLEAHPEVGAGTEVAAEPQGRVGGDGPPSPDDLADPCGRNAEREGQSIGAQTERGHELLAQDLARVDRFEQFGHR